MTVRVDSVISDRVDPATGSEGRYLALSRFESHVAAAVFLQPTDTIAATDVEDLLRARYVEGHRTEEPARVACGKRRYPSGEAVPAVKRLNVSGERASDYMTHVAFVVRSHHQVCALLDFVGVVERHLRRPGSSLSAGVSNLHKVRSHVRPV